MIEKRNLSEYQSKSYDLIVVGGGIYGIMIMLEASRRGLTSLLLEKKDFWSNTSLNHLRTVHGGLRYLQSFDLPRFYESITERKWFLKYFPDYIELLSCQMPLYGKGLHRNSILRMALILNDVLSLRKNSGLDKAHKMPHGKILSPEQIISEFPNIDKEGLTGAAQWYDAGMPELQRLYMKILNKSLSLGSDALNYVEVTGLKSTSTLEGVLAVDRLNDREIEFNAPIVINAAGPSSRRLAKGFDKDYDLLFKKRLLLWNVLFDRPALSQSALALNPEKGKGHTYFSHPWKNRLLVGTGEILVDESDTELRVPESEMSHFIRDLNMAVPGLELNSDEIVRVYSGVIPADENGKLSKRESIIDHAAEGGPNGLYSLAGIKFTTSRLVAEKLIGKIYPAMETIPYDSLFHDRTTGDLFFDYQEIPDQTKLEALKTIITNESVYRLSDLILRRTSLGDNPRRGLKVAEMLRPYFNCSDQEWQTEIEDLKNDFNTCYDTFAL